MCNDFCWAARFGNHYWKNFFLNCFVWLILCKKDITLATFLFFSRLIVHYSVKCIMSSSYDIHPFSHPIAFSWNVIFLFSHLAKFYSCLLSHLTFSFVISFLFHQCAIDNSIFVSLFYSVTMFSLFNVWHNS